MASLLFLLYFIFTLVVLYNALNLLVWEIGSAIYLIVATFFVGLPWVIGICLWLVITATIVVLRVDAIRNGIADFLFARARKSVPKLSKTEEEALKNIREAIQGYLEVLKKHKKIIPSEETRYVTIGA